MCLSVPALMAFNQKKFQMMIQMPSQFTITLRIRTLLAFALSLFISSAAFAGEPSLEGLWFETDNFPASSVMRFEKFGSGWIGRYVQVSPEQKNYGFSIGEAVIRGKLEGDKFRGEVLLKTTVVARYACPGLNVGWVPIEMVFAESNKLNGRWLQTQADYERGCVVVQQGWQPYRLEKLPAK